jgi:hypothetical protein
MRKCKTETARDKARQEMHRMRLGLGLYLESSVGLNFVVHAKFKVTFPFIDHSVTVTDTRVHGLRDQCKTIIERQDKIR